MRVTTLSLAALLAAAVPAMAAISSSDRAFLTKDVQGSNYELALAQLAAQKATNDQIKSYAQKVASDHEQANPQLQQLAQSKGVTPPQGMDSNDQTRLAGMQNLQGNDFDRAFVKEAKRINAEDKRDSAKEQRTTRDPDIRAFLKRFASMDAEHDQAAKALPTS